MANVASMDVQPYREESDMRDSPGRGLEAGEGRLKLGFR
jgi:hypothetical protein